MGAFFYFDLTQYLSLETLKANRDKLLFYSEAHYTTAASANSPSTMNFPTGDEAGWAAGLKCSGLLRGAGGIGDAPDDNPQKEQFQHQ